MKKLGLAALLVLAVVVARAEQLLPTDDGTTWTYDSTEEVGGPAAGPAVKSVLTIRVGRQTFDGKEFLKFETLSDDSLVKTELMTLDDKGLVCHARGGKDGRIAKLDPPQEIGRAHV